jgi:hypothetical protein
VHTGTIDYGVGLSDAAAWLFEWAMEAQKRLTLRASVAISFGIEGKIRAT